MAFSCSFEKGKPIRTLNYSFYLTNKSVIFLFAFGVAGLGFPIQGHLEINDLLDERLPPRQNGAKTKELAIKYVDSNGVQRCKGGPLLKGSQAYTKELHDF